MNFTSFSSAFSKIAFFGMLTGSAHSQSNQTGNVWEKYDSQGPGLNLIATLPIFDRRPDDAALCVISRFHIFPF